MNTVSGRPSVLSDEHSLKGKQRVVGALGPISTAFTLAWLATHRRLRAFLLGGTRLSIIVLWDPRGSERAQRSEGDLDAITQVVYGDDHAGA